MSTQISAAADVARESARQDNGQFGTQVRSEAVIELDDSPRAVTTAGACPDCGAPMLGKVGQRAAQVDGGYRTVRNGKPHTPTADVFAPGSHCPECHHTAAEMVVETKDGRYEYRLEDEGVIRVRDADGDTVGLWRPEDGQEWAEHVSTFGIDAQALRATLVDPRDLVAQRCADAGLGGYMADAYRAVLDRGRVPEAFVLGHATSADDVQSWHETYFDPAVDELGSNLVGAYDRNAKQSSMDELFSECDDADLPIMKDIYARLDERDELGNFTAANTTYDEVVGHYEDHIAPAIDQLEQRIATEYRYHSAERHLDDIEDALADVESNGYAHDDDDQHAEATRARDALEAAWDDFDNADGTQEALLAYADAVEKAGSKDIWDATHEDHAAADLRRIEVKFKTVADRIRASAARLA